ncbi:MAG: chloride channel protein [Phycisphaerae bacterium]
MFQALKQSFRRGRHLRVRFVDLLAKAGFGEEYLLILLSILIGAATGLGAYLFYELIEWATHSAYRAEGSLFNGRSLMLVLLPVVGALLTGFITTRFAREAKGHGVPEVMDAILRHGAVVRRRVALAKSVASALTIGSGGSAGTEGPIVQIGAAVGSGFGQMLRLHRQSMSVLVACGAAAGISAIFNAPIAGVLFALEIFLKDFSLRTFSPVVFASVISCSVMHGMVGEGDVAIFKVQHDAQYVFNGLELPFYLVLGLVCALVATGFIRALYATEDLADKVACPEYLKPAIGALGLGVLGVTFVSLSHTFSQQMPPFFGNGYPLIEQAIDGSAVFQLGMPLLLLLCLMKIVATCLTLGSGGSGGIFAPSLFMGATVGGAYGLLLNHLGIVNDTSVSAYALVGMAAVVAGTTHAPLTAIVILYEITREPKVILPIMFAAIVATFCAQKLCRDSIYTLKLRRRGVRMGTLADLTILKRITADQVRGARAVYVHPEDPLQKLIELAVENETGDFVVVDEQGVYQGLVVAEDIRTALLQPDAVPLLVVSELLREGVPTVSPFTTLDNVLDAFARSSVQSLPLVNAEDATHVDALITRQALMSRYQQELESQSG